eukprot:c171_g1_i1 orf=330-1448(-)
MPLPSDHFDTLPDALVLHILNKLCDVKALGQCSVVSKRFNLLALQAEDVIVKVDCVVSPEAAELSIKQRSTLTWLLQLFMGGIIKPLHVVQHLLHVVRHSHQQARVCRMPTRGTTTSANKKGACGNVSQHSPCEVLKNFKWVKHLRIELPEGELSIGKDVLLKWRAVFGSTLETCVILAASSMDEAGEKAACGTRGQEATRVEGFECQESGTFDGFTGFPESFLTNGGLKLRVAWTISSLIAASARHYLLQEIVNDHPTLETLILADADGQGTLCMHKEQLRAFRDQPISVCASSKRTQVPALNMKLWYAPFLDLTSGGAMQGVTLVAIQPSSQVRSKESDGLYSSAFEEPFKRAACSLIRRQTYMFEMNSF